MLQVLSSPIHRETLPVPNFSDKAWVEANQVIAVLSGGTEQLFLQLVEQGQVSLSRPVYLVATQTSNSLAACCEILSWINQHRGYGEIRFAE